MNAEFSMGARAVADDEPRPFEHRHAVPAAVPGLHPELKEPPRTRGQESVGAWNPPTELRLQIADLQIQSQIVTESARGSARA